ncbi:MAG: metal ABC transporter permease [Trueperaceae bacterium]|nr:MAG: metal ABC transporter permease [Trueperaceae bacterium]
MIQVLAFPFMQRAAAAGVLIAVMCALLGVFVVQRRLSFLGDGLAHAAFGGMGIGAFVIVSSGALAQGGALLRNPLWVAVPFALLTGLGIAWVRDRTELSSDTAIGVFFAVSVALGVLFFSRISPDANIGVNVMDLLFGSILAVRTTELTIIAVVAVIATTLLLALWGRLAYATFDDELARTDGVRSRLLEYLLFGLAAVVITVSATVVGIILMAAYLVIPAAAARIWARSMASMTLIAVVIGVSTTLAGVALSYLFDLPTGSAIILTQALVFVVAAFTQRR